jgi:hypothetical protein
VFADVNKYEATTHFVVQGTIFEATEDRATGEAYCLAHHVTVEGGREAGERSCLHRMYSREPKPSITKSSKILDWNTSNNEG